MGHPFFFYRFLQMRRELIGIINKNQLREFQYYFAYLWLYNPGVPGGGGDPSILQGINTLIICSARGQTGKSVNRTLSGCDIKASCSGRTNRGGCLLRPPFPLVHFFWTGKRNKQQYQKKKGAILGHPLHYSIITRWLLTAINSICPQFLFNAKQLVVLCYTVGAA
jgi:hypothetical protein